MESEVSIELELIRGDAEIFKKLLTSDYGIYRAKHVIEMFAEFSLKCKKYRGQCDWFYFYTSKFKNAVNLHEHYSRSDGIYVLARYDQFVVLDHPDSEHIYIIALPSESSAEFLHDALYTLSHIFINPPLPEEVLKFIAPLAEGSILEVLEKKTGLKFKLLLW